MIRGFGDEGGGSISDRLFEQRIVVVSGPLDDSACSELIARLLSLDALGDEAIALRISSAGGSPDGCLGIVDVLDALGVPVRATAVGRVEGAPIAVLAAAAHRSCGEHATFVLRGEKSSFSGPVRLLETFAAEQTRRLWAIAEVIARRSPLAAERIESDLSSHLTLNAQQARAYGLVDAVSGASASVVRSPGSLRNEQIGFRRPPEPRR